MLNMVIGVIVDVMTKEPLEGFKVEKEKIS